ncbi:MAG: DNRLRE domain-containing protein [Chitinivibrionales bacterium]|nr:DNRLRE domain-containing protein [Chitinivibrionales bacterium]
MRNSFFFLALALIFLSATVQSQQQKKILQNGLDNYVGCQDASIKQEEGSVVTKHNRQPSEDSSFRIEYWKSGGGKNGNGKSHEARALIVFDVTSIPSTASVTKATLLLYIPKSGESSIPQDNEGKFTNGPKSLFIITSSWDKNTVKWDAPWKTKGGDFSPTACATNAGNITNGWERYTVTEPIQLVVSKQKPNYGFLLKFDSNDQRYKSAYINSTHIDSVDKRPILEIEYGNQVSISPDQLPRLSIPKINTHNSLMVMSIPQRNTTVHLFDLKGRMHASVCSRMDHESFLITNYSTKNNIVIMRITCGQSMYAKKVIEVK